MALSKPVIDTVGDDLILISLKDVSCPICFEVKTDMLSPPLCGHLVCRECYTGMCAQAANGAAYVPQRIRDGLKCPICNGPGNWQPNKYAGMLAGRVPVSCPHKCGAERITVQSFPAHIAACPKVAAKCPHKTCKWTGIRGDIVAHREVCIEALVACPHCAQELHRGALALHEAACPYKTVSCMECRVTEAAWRMVQHVCRNVARDVPTPAESSAPNGDRSPFTYRMAAQENGWSLRPAYHPSDVVGAAPFPPIMVDNDERKEADGRPVSNFASLYPSLIVASNPEERKEAEVPCTACGFTVADSHLEAREVAGEVRAKCGTCNRWHGTREIRAGLITICAGCGLGEADRRQTRAEIPGACASHCTTCRCYAPAATRYNPESTACGSCGTLPGRGQPHRDGIGYTTAIHCAECRMWSSRIVLGAPPLSNAFQRRRANVANVLAEINRQVHAGEISPVAAMAMAADVDSVAERVLGQQPAENERSHGVFDDLACAVCNYSNNQTHAHEAPNRDQCGNCRRWYERDPVMDARANFFANAAVAYRQAEFDRDIGLSRELPRGYDRPSGLRGHIAPADDSDDDSDYDGMPELEEAPVEPPAHAFGAVAVEDDDDIYE